MTLFVGAGLALVLGGYWLATRDGQPTDVLGHERDEVSGDSETSADGAGRTRRKRVQKYPELDGLWERALQHFAAGEWAEGLALVAAGRRAGRRYFEHPERRQAVLAAEDAALRKLEDLLRKRAKDAGLAEASRLEPVLVDAEGQERLAELRAKLEALRELVGWEKVVAAADTAEDRAQLERHLARFAGGAGPSEPRTPDWVDALLKSVPERTYRRGKKRERGAIEPLPVADDDAAEARRILQLEKLRQREAIGLLDHIHAGLAWLALHQGGDGEVSDGRVHARCLELRHVPQCAKERSLHPVASTALAVLAFLDFRDQDKTGLFEPSLSAGVDWLLAQQRDDGSFPQARGYAPAIALMALGQAASSSGRADVRQAVEEALTFYAGTAGPGGGYRYRPRQAGDLSATGWYVQALEAARDAGVQPPEALLENLRTFVHSCRDTDKGWGYLAGQKQRTSLQAVGMLSELILDEHDTSTELRPGDGPGDGTQARHNPHGALLDGWRAELAKRPSVLSEKAASKPKARPGTHLYTLYYEVRVQLALDGKLSEGRRQRVFILANNWQAREGDKAGMFTLSGGWVPRSGAALQTAFAVLTLEHALYRR